MKRFLTFYLLFLLSSLAFPLFSQTEKKQVESHSFTYQYLTTKEGLSNQRVFSIIQDQRGFIWVATRSGVDCFDGRNVKNYNLFGEDIIIDGSGGIINLTKDCRQTIRAYTSSGKIFRYSPITDSFTLEIDFVELSKGVVFLNQLLVDSQGQFWLGLNNGLFLYNASSGMHTVMKDKQINSMLFSPSSQLLYIATTEGLYTYDRQTDRTRLLLPNINIQSIFYDETTRFLWLGTFNTGVKVQDTKTGKFLSCESLQQLPPLPYRSIIAYNDETLLLGVDGAGVYAIGRDANHSRVFLNANKEEEKGKLNGNGVYAICKDCSSNLWIGSYTGGVTFANPRKYVFELIQHEYKNTQSLINNHVNAILEDREGDLWYATNQGISVHFTQTGNWKHFLKDNVFLTLCNGVDGDVWAGGYGTGAYYLNKHTGIRKHFTTAQPGTLRTNYLYSIAKDEDNEMWFGGMYGNLVRYTPANQGKPEKFSTYNITLINSITIVNKDTIALATVNGFYLLNKRTGIFKHHFPSPSYANTRSNSFIYSMHFTSTGKVWFGTDGGGINVYDLKTEKAVTYSTANGLPSNYIYSILPDKEGRLWLSTDKGLAYITLCSSPEITNIGFLDGLANEFNFMSFTRLSNGDFIYGSTNGAVRFNPESFTCHFYEAPLVFTSFEVPQKSRELTLEKKNLFNQMLSDGKMIQLKYNENSFLISFISLSYQYQEDIQYSYQLEGFEQNWSLPGSALSVRYTNIPPGDYTFRVKSMSKNSKQQLDEKTIRIHIAQPFWNTGIAWFIYIFLLAGIIYFVWRFFANKMERKHFSEKIQFFINTAHDIRTPVTLIMAPLGDLSKEQGLSAEGKGYLQIARKNTEKLYNLITQLLDFQKADTTHLTLQVTEYDLKVYLQEKVISFQSLCDSKQISMQLLLPEASVTLWMDKDKVDKIFDNLLSNAIKYTSPKGEIIVKVQQNDKKINIEVKDNGIGIPQKAQRYIFSNFYRAENAVNSKETGSGIGLLLTRRLMKLHKGYISFTSNEGEGSSFLLTFRPGNKHLARYIISNPSTLLSALPSESSQVSADLPDIPEAGDASATDSSKERIMIVEDNDELRFYLKKTFEQIYTVIDKPDGESALEYLHDQSVELIISDVMMPGIQGDELCRRLKSDFTTSHIPVILLTAKTEKDAILEGLESGADDYLTKPFDTEILKTKIKGVLQNRHIMREHFLSHSLDLAHSAKQFEEPSTKQVAKDCFSQLSPMDKDFLERCTKLVTAHVSDPEFNINQLCRELALSRTLFYEKLKSLTGQAPNDFIKLIRMEEAGVLLRKQIPVQEVALLVGFTDPKYFSTAFKKHYGVSPSKFV